MRPCCNRQTSMTRWKVPTSGNLMRRPSPWSCPTTSSPPTTPSSWSWSKTTIWTGARSLAGPTRTAEVSRIGNRISNTSTYVRTDYARLIYVYVYPTFIKPVIYRDNVVCCYDTWRDCKCFSRHQLKCNFYRALEERSVQASLLWLLLEFFFF